MKHEVGDLVRYQWHDWKCPPKQELLGIVVSINEKPWGQDADMIEIYWTGSDSTSFVFADALQIVSKKQQ